MPWPGKRPAATTETRAANRRQRRRFSPLHRWLPTALFGLFVGSVIFLFAALRILAQTPETAQSATAPVVEAVQQVPEVVVAALPQQAPAPAPGEIVSRQGGITFTVRQVEPSYTVVSGDSLSSIAQRYGTTAEAIQGINNLPDSFLRVNQRLVLP